MAFKHIARYISAFEIGESHVLHPYIHRILFENGYPIPTSYEDISTKTYLKDNYPKLFNIYQPDIPTFHDAPSRDDMLLNQAYINLCFGRGCDRESNKKIHEFRDVATAQQLDLQAALAKCKENTGLTLCAGVLSHRLYIKDYYLVSAAISADVVDKQSTVSFLPTPEDEEQFLPKKRTLLECVQMYKNRRPYDRELQQMIKQLSSER